MKNKNRKLKVVSESKILLQTTKITFPGITVHYDDSLRQCFGPKTMPMCIMGLMLAFFRKHQPGHLVTNSLCKFSPYAKLSH